MVIPFSDKTADSYRYLYYSDWHRENPHIGRVELDGKNNQVFVSEDIRLPNGLALVHSRRELCWVDAGNQRYSGTIFVISR